jgi:hypothetical protein
MNDLSALLVDFSGDELDDVEASNEIALLSPGSDPVRANQTRLPFTCSGAAAARVLLVRAHLLVAYCN